MPFQEAQPQATTVTVQPAPTATLPSTAATASEMYEAMQAQSRELDSQLRELEGARRRLANELRDPTVMGADRTGLEARLGQLDGRITQIEAQRLVAGQQLALAAAQPGAVIQPPDSIRDDIHAFSAFLTVVIAIPLTIAWARRIWRRQTVVHAIPPELGDRLVSIERAVDAVALEVERIGEGQRFVTQLMAARREGEPHQLPGQQP
jgi:hypothetical protein